MVWPKRVKICNTAIPGLIYKIIERNEVATVARLKFYGRKTPYDNKRKDLLKDRHQNWTQKKKTASNHLSQAKSLEAVNLPVSGPTACTRLWQNWVSPLAPSLRLSHVYDNNMSIVAHLPTPGHKWHLVLTQTRTSHNNTLNIDGNISLSNKSLFSSGPLRVAPQ